MKSARGLSFYSQFFRNIVVLFRPNMSNPLSSSVKLALIFLVFGVLWILCSDMISLSIAYQNLPLYNLLQHSKGILFIILAAILIYFVSRRLYAKIEKAHKEEQETLRRYQMLAMATNDAIWDVNLETGECYTNRTLQEMFGYTETELRDNNNWWRNHLHPDDKERVMSLLNSTLAMGGTIWNDEYRLIGAMQDVTAQRNLQHKLSEEREQHRNEIAQRILQAEEAERKKLGEELHDNINQMLGVVKLYLQHSQVNPNMRQELLAKCSDYVGQTIEEIRQLSRSLLPPALNEDGLLNSLDQLVEDIRHAKAIQIEIDSEGFSEDAIPSARQLMLYRIIQEQLNNVLKHSGADKVIIRLRKSDQLVNCAIQDNGTGFDVDKNKPGMGLINIRSRLDVANGQMRLQSAPGAGCTLEVEFGV